MGSITLCRSAENDIVLRDSKVSRRHARVDISADDVRLVDLGSRQGTHVDEVRVEEAVLQSGQKIRIGDYRLEIEGHRRHAAGHARRRTGGRVRRGQRR